jgi:hypothetical protein
MRKMKKNCAYLVSKPIQYVNVLNLPVSENLKVLLLIDSFHNASTFFNEIKNSNTRWHEVHFFSSVLEALKWLRKNRDVFTELYTFSDYGLKLHYHLYRLKPLNIYLYEEGWASYIGNMFPRFSLNAFIHFSLSFNIHSGQYIGSSSQVKGLFVYHTALHRKLIPFCKKPIYSFSKVLLEHIDKNPELSFFIFKTNESFKNQKIVLYISGWLYNEKMDSLLNLYSEQKIIFKPHPQLKRTATIDSKFNFIIDGNYLAEFIIAKLISEVDQLTIIHESSTSLFHFINNPKIKEINLGSQLSDEKQYLKIRRAMNEFYHV